MAVDIDIRTTGVRKLMRSLEAFDKRIAQTATQRALNRTINDMRETAIREGALWMGIKKSLVAKRFGFDVKRRHGAMGIKGARRGIAMEASTIAKGRPFNLIRWNATQMPTGVSSDAWGERKIYKDTKIIKGKFVARLSKHLVDREGRRRLMNRSAFGPGLTHALQEPKIVDNVQTTGVFRFEHHFVQRANELMRRAGFGKIGARGA